MSPVIRLAGALALAAALAAPLCASAQGWRRFDYADSGFAFQLPAPPQVSEGPYRTSGGLTVPSKTWTLKQDDIVYTMTVADFSSTAVEKDAALDEAVKALAARGEIKADVTERINREYGRQVTVVGRDGARSTVSIFFVNHKLYQQEGRALPPDPGAGSSKAVRFQQSLEFTGPPL